MATEDDTFESDDESMEGASGNAASRSVEQLGKQLQKLVNRSVQEGFGPITGSAVYADARLAKVMGRPVTSGDLRAEATPEQIERVISRVISESPTATGAAGFTTGLGGFTTPWCFCPPTSRAHSSSTRTSPAPSPTSADTNGPTLM